MNLNIDKSDWKNVRLGDVATAPSIRINNPSESGFDRFIGNANIGQWDFRLTSWETTTSVTSAMKVFEAADYLFVRRSLYASDFRERSPRASFPGVCSGDIITIREDPALIADGFLIGVLNSPAIWKYVVANASGSITRRIKWRDLANYEFLLPPKDQQTKLAELLWAADRQLRHALDVADRLTTLYATRRESLCFEQSLNGESEWHPRLKKDVPIKTKYSRLGVHLVDIRYGTSKKSNSNEKGTQCVGIPHVLNENLNSEGAAFVELTEKEQRLIQLGANDILIVRTNGNASYTGRSALVSTDTDLVFASYLIRLRVNEEKFDPKFLVRYLQTQTIRKYFRRHATSSAGNYNINTQDIKGVPVPEIDISKQTSIANDLSALEGKRISARTAATSSGQLLKSLINQIF